MVMSSEFSCAKCGSCEVAAGENDSCEEEDREETLCEHCNEDLIARNLANEIMHHELLIKRDEEDENDEGDIEVKIKSEGDEVEGESDGGEENADKQNNEDDDDDDDDDDDADEEEEDGPVVRRSSRSTLNKYKNPDLEPPEPQVGSRRSKLFRRQPVYKSPNGQATTVTSPYVFHRGVYYQLGDIVAINDIRGRGIFYAQITGFMTDQYCNKKATIQWLLPTIESPDHNVAFDPRSYYLGYIEDVPRPLEFLIPVMHAPSDYYRFNASPYPPVIPPPHIAKYVWHNFERIYIKRCGI